MINKSKKAKGLLTCFLPLWLILDVSPSGGIMTVKQNGVCFLEMHRQQECSPSPKAYCGKCVGNCETLEKQRDWLGRIWNISLEEKGLAPAATEEPRFKKPSFLVCKSNLSQSGMRNTLLVLGADKPWASD